MSMSKAPLLDWIESQEPGKANRDAVYVETRPNHPSQEQRVLDYIRSVPDATREEIADGMGIPLSYVCGRVRSLIDSQQVEETRNLRRTKFGKPAVAVRAVQKGPAA